MSIISNGQPERITPGTYIRNKSGDFVPAESSINMYFRDRDSDSTKIVGIGGAPTRATTLPTDGAERKKFPVGTGVLDYFPDALVAISAVSYAGNEQHNPGKPLHWDRSKSADESDTMIRHYLERGTKDTDGHRHSAKMAWRALAILQKEIEEDNKKTLNEQIHAAVEGRQKLNVAIMQAKEEHQAAINNFEKERTFEF